jgi:hypothetical protein
LCPGARKVPEHALRAAPHFRIALSRFLAHKRAMLAKVCSAAVNGIEAYPVEVEVNAGFGDTLIVIIVSISPISELAFLRRQNLSRSASLKNGGPTLSSHPRRKV